ncbi:MAG: TspO/MBR family protein [Pseudomonadota bacterium]
MLSSSLISLGAFVCVNFIAAGSGAVFKPGAWYEGLEKPGWTPPNIAFPIVWTVLFLLNAAAGWLIWEQAPDQRGVNFTVYGVSLVLNALWSALFFGARRMTLALIDVSALWLSIAIVAALFAPINLFAAALLVPYLIWVGLAGLLNWRIIELNPRERVA